MTSVLSVRLCRSLLWQFVGYLNFINFVRSTCLSLYLLLISNQGPSCFISPPFAINFLTFEFEVKVNGSRILPTNPPLVQRHTPISGIPTVSGSMKRSNLRLALTSGYSDLY